MIRAKDGNGCCSSWCCCIRQQIAELWQRIEGTVRGVKMNGNIIEPDGDGIVDLDVNFPVDGAMDPTSVNPVQNRVITDAILTERNERIEDDRRHDLQIQGLQTEVATKLTTPSGGVQGQVLGKGAQGIEWMDQQGGSSGGTWEAIDLSNWPTDWEIGDRVRMIVNYPIQASGTNPGDWNTAPTWRIFNYNTYKVYYEIEAFYDGSNLIAQPIETNPNNIKRRYVAEVVQINIFNNGSVNGYTSCYNGAGYIVSSTATSTDVDEAKRIDIISAARLRIS